MKIQNHDFLLFAGPCSLESEEHIKTSFEFLAKLPLTAVRCSIFKARTSHKSFQGAGLKHLGLIKSLKESLNLKLVTEVTRPSQIESLVDIVDIFQVGARNMFNYELLKDLASCKQPILLKRSFAASIDEWISASQYLKSENVILCERGIRTFETKTRNTFDINAIAYLKQNESFPVIADPSHGTGIKNLVTPIALASIHAGADGLIIETHENPSKALSDAEQALSFKEFEDFVLKTLPEHLKLAGKTILTDF